jgi:hypothetical protein
MRSTLVLLVVTCMELGCGTGASDEERQAVDALVDDADAAPQVACTGAVYDACTDNTQCTSQNCHLFAQDGIQVCTQACDGESCPDFGGSGFCNTKGIYQAGRRTPAPRNDEHCSAWCGARPSRGAPGREVHGRHRRGCAALLSSFFSLLP